MFVFWMPRPRDRVGNELLAVHLDRRSGKRPVLPADQLLNVQDGRLLEVPIIEGHEEPHVIEPPFRSEAHFSVHELLQDVGHGIDIDLQYALSWRFVRSDESTSRIEMKGDMRIWIIDIRA